MSWFQNYKNYVDKMEKIFLKENASNQHHGLVRFSVNVEMWFRIF